MSRFRSIIFISGNGSNLQNIIDNIKSDYLKMDIVLVISDNYEAKGLKKAKENGIETLVINTSDKYIDELLHLMNNYKVDLIILSGFMKILPKVFVEKYYGKIINIHPSLLPKFKGLNTHKKALASKERYHGASVHFVTSELDGGPVIVQGKTEIQENDNEDALKSRVHQIEYNIFPLAIKWFVENHIKQIDNKCFFDNEVLECPIEHLSD
ncbi:MAG: phosphoribosylglycinamide formyltransferase [Gammaproteobacteria bacterium]|nr:phosphoribosylglycinamide formyltransferase [Gammaproteobacteria bacterium]MBT5407176.1 phosphoribosylglycinamide formyltransferase [Gammaproteobacteria bacterium]MBT5644499.1 phosphoribosylglycinamide formyltransferase [Gammaproteobacteria bacterium]MBT5863878.1 phosphoribosylglycinamide formyltransferase [Gammaproteobacteria bacterium]MBT6734081.1 phosphoribosylglycinamide formyltransferase [Gammaproteobacteria bacterium]|tara:strand:- start:7719 stop:8351 length:633 start_codon:yes stop_codon:yes gene_type:complete